MESKEITLKVKKVIIVESTGADSIHLFLTNVTEAIFPGMKYDPIAKINAAKGNGVKWCEINLGITPEIIKIP